MAINLAFERLREHYGHHIEITFFGRNLGSATEMNIECKNCSTDLVSEVREASLHDSKVPLGPFARAADAAYSLAVGGTDPIEPFTAEQVRLKAPDDALRTFVIFEADAMATWGDAVDALNTAATELKDTARQLYLAERR